MKNIDKIIDFYPEETFLTADGFDDAIVGICDSSQRIIYSTTKILQNLVNSGMDEMEAQEYFTFNISGAYMGPDTPIFLDDSMFE